MIKLTKNYFKNRTPLRCDIQFRTENMTEDGYATASLSDAKDVKNL